VPLGSTRACEGADDEDGVTNTPGLPDDPNRFPDFRFRIQRIKQNWQLQRSTQ